MKLFISILTLLSFLLIGQIDCNDVSFSTIVDQFYRKASKKGFDLQPNLSFIVRFPYYKRILGKCNAPVKEFLDHTKFLRIQNTLPSLKKDIVLIYNNTIRTRSLYDKIIRALEFKLPIESDKILKKSYEKWEKDPDIDMAILNEIKNSMIATQLECSVYIERCREHMNAADKIKLNVEEFFDSANTSFDNIFTQNSTTLNNAKHIVQEAGKILASIKKEQNKLFIMLYKVIFILSFYNDLRMTYVEYIVGLRDSITSEIRNEYEEIHF
ncbi:uncharacterized protein LOC116341189 [Contarinia nasturtii]|uniref:uncharacterized protein LOC116341189 n=1 Tax=Contarinia nasturtii TaxID=265458 RepID=UPI0012D4574A|nr:uncharacterized protein LOC116341189 [Contarinia nasturtii]